MKKVIFKKILSIFRTIIELLYPIYCYGCRYEWVGEKGLCLQCEQSLQPVVSTICQLTETKKIPVFAAYAYRGPLCDIIRAKKRSDICAARLLGRMIDEVLYELRGQIDYFVSVPLHQTRQAERGFNQAQVMAELLSERWKIPCEEIVLRKKNTKYQASVSAINRQKNVEDAFEWVDDEAKKRLFKKRICIVDDLFTTGSTVRSLGHLLMQARPESIMVMVAARAIDL
ncbi:ComF family protein [Candidatus Babeliales bacterium]|nr:ComF family protein [Candidatus Babeliales bacterium]